MPWLEIRDLCLGVRLGCSPDERSKPQEVKVSVRLEFSELPPACNTDHLDGTVCYGKLCERMRKIATTREFQTIEFLCSELAKAISPIVGTRAKGTLSVHKVKPPVDDL